MCHLLAITSNTYASAADGIEGIAAMQADNSGSGVGILLRDLGGLFKDIKNLPVLSGIFSNSGLKRLDRFMMEQGFKTKYLSAFKRPETPPENTPQRDSYLMRAYEYPPHWEEDTPEQRQEKLVDIRLRLSRMGEEQHDMMVFSFWPDTIMIKETGNPLEISQYLKLDREDLSARVMMIQSSQKSYQASHPYSCHPFFFKGFSVMTNGENTASKTNRDFLHSRNYPSYNGRMSDPAVFTHILHYTIATLDLDIAAYKHIITPLTGKHLETHPDKTFLTRLQHSCRQMITDGPNCILGCLPDNTLFMAQDRKKRCPGVIGGEPGMYAFASDTCGLDAVLPGRDPKKDIQPMHLDTVIAGPNGNSLKTVRQTDPLIPLSVN